jgi:hypothetical protein
MNRTRLALLVLALIAAACAVSSTNLRLEMLNTESLPAGEVTEQVATLHGRVEGLWGSLHHAKLSTDLTKKRIAEYFENSEDLSDFVAIYASLMREKNFESEKVQHFEIGQIKLELNGVQARVEVTLWGTIYFIWRHRIHEVEMWKNVDGVWVMKPMPS